ncbi:hypothetical protein QYM36_007788 [Artemia franciscana]|uniref:Uncharacterized protein n=1 Tax=Artemia franciscana TaxID=6661 RepID=A0AA88LLV8_ARTSF|nr:hypothetical protein QYM36_007788 [Artemia franciscana]
MGKRNREPETPRFPVENKICYVLFICQMVAVLSAVSMVYLTVASYVPSLKAIDLGMDETPIMCTTLQAGAAVEDANWTTCGEWCLSKSSGGAAMQIWVQARNNGSTLRFENCTETSYRVCDIFPSIESLDSYYCRKDECKTLHGLFNCSEGICRNVTDWFQCKLDFFEPPRRCIRRIDCFHITGLHFCDNGLCFRANKSYDCEKLCPEIPSKNKNIIALMGDQNVLANCQKVVHIDSNETLWTSELQKLLMISCHIVNISPDKKTLEATDCVDAVLRPLSIFGDRTNFSDVTKIYRASTDLLPSSQSGYQIPLEHELVIFNRTKLHINIEVKEQISTKPYSLQNYNYIHYHLHAMSCFCQY